MSVFINRLHVGIISNRWYEADPRSHQLWWIAHINCRCLGLCQSPVTATCIFYSVSPSNSLGYPFVTQRSHRAEASPLPAQLSQECCKRPKAALMWEEKGPCRAKAGAPHWGMPEPEQWGLPALPQAASSLFHTSCSTKPQIRGKLQKDFHFHMFKHSPLSPAEVTLKMNPQVLIPRRSEALTAQLTQRSCRDKDTFKTPMCVHTADIAQAMPEINAVNRACRCSEWLQLFSSSYQEQWVYTPIYYNEIYILKYISKKK